MSLVSIILLIMQFYGCVYSLPTETSQLTTTEEPEITTPVPLRLPPEWLGEDPITAEKVVNEVVEYFSRQDPHGIPVLKIPEPIYSENRVTGGGITLWELQISGLSEIRLDYINLNFTTFTGIGRVSLPLANLLAQYQWPGWWSTSEGNANITFTQIQLTLNLGLGIDDEGVLKVDDLVIDVTYLQLLLDFTGLASEHSIMVSAADTFFSSIIQPIIVGKLQDLVRGLLNRKLQSAFANQPFPDSISPMDYAVAKMRRNLRQQDLDPLTIDRKEVTMAWEITLLLKDINLSGLTTIHRTHEVSAEFIDNAIFATLQVGTQELRGGADWSISAALLPAISGHFDVEVESLAVTVEMKQPANIRSPPVLRKIDVQLGNLAVRSKGERTMDYAIELLVNIVPNIFRNLIMDKIEPKLHQIIQKELNGLDLHRIIMDKLAEKRRKEELEAAALEAEGEATESP